MTAIPRFVLLLVVLLFAAGACSRPPPRTSANAAPSDVTFLSIPSDAKAIRFWDHYHDRILVVETSEESFRAMFPSITFKEVKEPRVYHTGGFGDPSKLPSRRPDAGNRQVANGILFEKFAPNGGGEVILYDRAIGTGYYHWVAW